MDAGLVSGRISTDRIPLGRVAQVRARTVGSAGGSREPHADDGNRCPSPFK